MSHMVNLARLRKDAPTWAWKAERYGFGWIYRGERGPNRVTVQAFSVLSGPSDDDFRTEYYATTDIESMPYFSWLWHAGVREAHTPPNKEGAR